MGFAQVYQEIGYVPTDGNGKHKSGANPEWSWKFIQHPKRK